MADLPSYTPGRPAEWDLIPAHMVGGLRRFIENGIEPGSFLSAVLSNDLRGACEKADDENRYRLFGYVQFLYCYAPTGCWGSPANFKDWCERGGLLGRAA